MTVAEVEVGDFDTTRLNSVRLYTDPKALLILGHGQVLVALLPRRGRPILRLLEVEGVRDAILLDGHCLVTLGGEGRVHEWQHEGWPWAVKGGWRRGACLGEGVQALEGNRHCLWLSLRDGRLVRVEEQAKEEEQEKQAKEEQVEEEEVEEEEEGKAKGGRWVVTADYALGLSFTALRAEAAVEEGSRAEAGVVYGVDGRGAGYRIVGNEATCVLADGLLGAGHFEGSLLSKHNCVYRLSNQASISCAATLQPITAVIGNRAMALDGSEFILDWVTGQSTSSGRRTHPDHDDGADGHDPADLEGGEEEGEGEGEDEKREMILASASVGENWVLLRRRLDSLQVSCCLAWDDEDNSVDLTPHSELRWAEDGTLVETIIEGGQPLWYCEECQRAGRNVIQRTRSHCRRCSSRIISRLK